MADKNPILEAAKRIPAQVAMGPADLLNLALGLVSGNGLGGVTPKSPSETINQDLLGLPEPELLSAQGGIELASGFVNPAKALAAVGKATAMSAPALLALMQKASVGTTGKIANKQAGIIGGIKYAEALGVDDILKKAKDMYEAGISNHRIAQETSQELASRRNPGQAMSVFIGPDSKPRLVVGNDYSSIVSGKQDIYKGVITPRIVEGEAIPLSEMLLHPSLYEGSEIASKMKVRVNEDLQRNTAQYLAKENVVELSKHFQAPATIKNDPEEFLAWVLRHEAGHGIQLEEGHRLGTGTTTASQLFSVEDALAKGSFRSAGELQTMQQSLRQDLPFADLQDMLKEPQRLRDYGANYGEWETEFGAKMNSAAFPLSYEGKKTW